MSAWARRRWHNTLPPPRRNVLAARDGIPVAGVLGALPDMDIMYRSIIVADVTRILAISPNISGLPI